MPEALIRLSRQSGMGAADMQVFEAMSRRGWLIIIRCPKPEARAWHGTFGPKTGATSAKSGTSGLVVTASRIMVSDYDLMSVWQRVGVQWQKLFIAPEGRAKRGPLTPQARAFMLEANARLAVRRRRPFYPLKPDPLRRGMSGVKSVTRHPSSGGVRSA